MTKNQQQRILLETESVPAVTSLKFASVSDKTCPWTTEAKRAKDSSENFMVESVVRSIMSIAKLFSKNNIKVHNDEINFWLRSSGQLYR
jgi:hypothetical protein